MPVAFKEWAVTVRALAEGEQLLTLRKGGIREENKHFELEHDRFFLYPTFDHQRNNLVRQSHHPELRRALEEGVWADGEPPPKALIQDGGIAAARARSDPRLGRGARALRGRPTRGSSTASARSTSGLPTTPSSGCAGSRATRCTCWCCASTGSRGPVTVRVRPEYARLRVLGRDRPRAAVRGHARDRRRGVRARRRRRSTRSSARPASLAGAASLA